MLALFSGKTYVRIANAWDVTYLPGTGSTGDAVTDIKFYREDLALRSEPFTRTGCTQTGWSKADDGEKDYNLGDLYTEDAALTLYPVWNANQYTITSIRTAVRMLPPSRRLTARPSSPPQILPSPATPSLAGIPNSPRQCPRKI